VPRFVNWVVSDMAADRLIETRHDTGNDVGVDRAVLRVLVDRPKNDWLARAAKATSENANRKWLYCLQKTLDHQLISARNTAISSGAVQERNVLHSVIHRDCG
jgi:hypothetical protein